MCRWSTSWATLFGTHARRDSMQRNLELLILMVATLAPVFLFAGTIDGDEFLKGGTGLLSGGAVFAAYSMWQKRGRQ